MNRAMQLYHQGFQAANNLTQEASGTSHLAFAQKMQSMITKDMRDAASAKSGGVPGFRWSLYDCYVHLDSNRGNWTDDTWQGNGVYKIPLGFQTFMEEVEKRGEVIRSTHSEWKRSQQSLTTWKTNAHWGALGGHLSNAQTAIDKVGPKIWTALGASADTAAAHVGHITKWIGYAGKMKDLMDRSVRVTEAGGGKGAQRQLVAEVVAFVVAELPVFGSAYADVIRSVPKMMSFFEESVRARNNAIEGRF